jgi:glycerophosphoryl diester phosphodiesterase
VGSAVNVQVIEMRTDDSMHTDQTGHGGRTVIVFGHRGARGEAPENTLAGFDYARRVGVDGFELDVRLSADGQLVVMHDETVDRTTDATGRVSEFTADQLAQLDARRSYPVWPERVSVPTLEQVLDAFADLPRFEIEVKRDTPERLELVCAQLITIIARYDLAGRATVSSFDETALRIVRRLAPQLPRAYIGAYDELRYLTTAIDLGCAQADIPLASNAPELVREAQARGLVVTGWLGNSEEEVESLVAWNVDHITTDYPSLALDVLKGLSSE